MSTENSKRTGRDPLQVKRMVPAESLRTFDRIAQSDWGAKGKLTLMSLQEVAERFGQRWPVRAENVYEHVERALIRNLGADALFARVSATDYLIAQPSLEPQIGQAVTLKILREILTHFLGQSQAAAVAVMVVRVADQQCIEAGPIDAAAVGKLAEQSLERLNATGAPPTPLPAANAWSPFVASDGRTLHVNCSLETVLSLRTCKVLGVRIRREVLAGAEGAKMSARQVSIMSRADIATIDRAAIYQGMQMVREGRQRPLMLGLPMSVLTLNSSRGRQTMLEAMKEARELSAAGLICGLQHVEESPSTNLQAAKALVQPHCVKTVATFIDPTRAGIRALRYAGIDAVGVDAPPIEGEAQFIGWTKALISWAAETVGGVGLYNLPTERTAALAAKLGVHFGSLKPSARQ